MTTARKETNKYLRRFKTIWMSAVVLLVVLFVLPLIYNVAYAGKIYPGVKLGTLNVGRLSPDEAEAALRVAWDKVAQTGWPIELGDGRKITLPATVTSAGDIDLTYSLVAVEVDNTIYEAASWPAGRNILVRLWGPLWARLGGINIELKKNIETDRVIAFIRENFAGLEQLPQPADFALDAAGNLQVVSEKTGTVINREPFFSALYQRVNNFSNEPITLEVKTQVPSVTELMVGKLLPQAKALQINKTITLTDEDKTWELKPETWQAWIGVESVAGQLQATLTTVKAQAYLDTLAKTVNKAAQDAKFDIQDGRVKQFQSSQTGRTLQAAATLEVINQAARSSDTNNMSLVITTEEPTVTTGEANDLGITEIIGVGTSNFSGSPKNRRHNIKVGADTLNGILIKPDEEFSLLKALGPVDGEHGYLQELVIKGNKTIPEYGGGLCQIGTTTFRAALASGLPIVERRNHSYRVVYYEPAGTDATIYDPKPDFRFNNDTGRAILIQTKIQGDDLIFEFWGTKDGRRVEQTPPRIFNITAPPPSKIVETEDLPVGEKRCTERAHNGADAEFTYTVTYPSGEVKQEVFKSHYIPWQEVCLVGVPKGTLQQVTEDGSVLPTADTQGQAGN